MDYFCINLAHLAWLYARSCVLVSGTSAKLNSFETRKEREEKVMHWDDGVMLTRHEADSMAGVMGPSFRTALNRTIDSAYAAYKTSLGNCLELSNLAFLYIFQYIKQYNLQYMLSVQINHMFFGDHVCVIIEHSPPSQYYSQYYICDPLSDDGWGQYTNSRKDIKRLIKGCRYDVRNHRNLFPEIPAYEFVLVKISSKKYQQFTHAQTQRLSELFYKVRFPEPHELSSPSFSSALASIFM